MGKIKEWLLEGEKDERFLISDIAKHGCSGGVGGLIYYDEVKEFYKDYEEDVWKYCTEAAEACGEPVLSLLDKSIASHATFANAMVWLAVECCAQELVAAKEAA